MSLRVRIWCRDCSFGQDPMGCFEGGSELLTEDVSPYDVLLFSTLREAVDAGHEAIRGVAPYRFSVEWADGEDEGGDIDYHNMTEQEISAFIVDNLSAVR